MDSTSICPTKHSRYEGYEKLGSDPKRQKAEVLARRTSYRLNSRGSGIFTFYRRRGDIAQAHDEVRT